MKATVIDSIQFKRGTKAALEAKLISKSKGGLGVLLNGEPAFEVSANSKAGKLKIGDGVHDYKDLPYVAGADFDNLPTFIINSATDQEVLSYNARTKAWENRSLTDILRPQLDEITSQTTIATGAAIDAQSALSEARAYAQNAGRSAEEAEIINQATMNLLNNKFHFVSIEEYNQQEEVGKDEIYFITIGD